MLNDLPTDQLLLLLTVAISCVSVVINVWRSRLTDGRATQLTALGVLSVAGIALLVWREQAGTISIAVWLLFLLVPVLLGRMVSQAVLSQNFGRARRAATLLRWLQPFGPWASYVRLMRANEAVATGDLATAERLLADYKTDTPLGRMVVAQLYRLQQRWPDLLALTHAAIARSDFGRHSSDLTLLAAHLRALGQTGALNELVETTTRYQALLHKAPWLIDQARLFVYAFCGRQAALELLLQQHSLTAWPPSVLRYWRAVAAAAAGQTDRAHTELTKLVTEGDQLTQNAAKVYLTRLAAPSSPAAALLTPSAQQQLDELERNHRRAIEAGLSPVRTTGRPWVTYGLILLNVVVFAVEWFAGALEQLDVLYDMGALVPIVVVADGQWWRLVSSTFLHFSVMHITFNMLALWYLGRLVEAKLGAVRYLILYLLAGILSMSMYLVLLWLHLVEPFTLVAGASGSIMGLVGAEAAILLRLWRSDGSTVARQRFIATALIIVMQASLDLLMPEFSFTGHLSGAVIGFVLASLLYRRRANN